MIKSVVRELIKDGHPVSHAHIRYLKPFPRNLGALLKKFDQIMIPEINSGQLIKVIRDKFLIDATGYNKVQGMPITSIELRDAILALLKN